MTVRHGLVAVAGFLMLAGPAAAQGLRIANVTIVSPERDAQPGMDVIVRDGRIAAITRTGKADGIPTIDGRGRYLTPGLIDSHVHLGAISGMRPDQEAAHPDIARAAWEQMPRSFLLHGYTTVVDLISTGEAMARWKRAPLMPDTFFCGGAVPMDGYPMAMLPPAVRSQMPYMLIEPGQTPPPGIDPAQHTPAAVVARMKKDGAICVKTTFERGFGPVRDLPVPKLDTIRELVRAAHAQGMPVMLHANGLEAQEFGVAAGVDVIVHGMWNTPPNSDETQQRIRRALDGIIASKIGWQPTIQVLKGLSAMFDPAFLASADLRRVQPASLIAWYATADGQWFRDEIAKEAPPGPPPPGGFLPTRQVRKAQAYLASRGGRLLFGTDTPSAPTYANPPGLNGWLEMQNWMEAGVTPLQLFQAATIENARALNLDREIGTVEVGKRANLLLLKEDPRQTIAAWRGIEKVILGGKALDPASLAAP
jgi:imidazolonepropionase-like amidohydrolase